MWIKGLKSEVGEVLRVVGKAVKVRTTLPVLSGVFLEAKDGKLKAFSTDLEVSLIKEIKVNVLNEGKVVVPARYFSDVIKNLPEGVIELKVENEDNVLKLSCEGNEFSFNTFQPEEFPKEPEKPGEDLFYLSIEAITLSELFQSVVRSASKDEARINLNGVLLKIGQGLIEACATDTYRLALRRAAVERVPEGREVIIPAAVAEETVKLLADLEGKIKLYFLENQLLIESNDFTEFIRLIEGQFPNYQGLIPDTFETEVLVSREDLSEGLKRLQVFSDSGTVEFKVGEGKLSIAAASQVVGKGSVQVEASVKGPEITLGFNSTYLQDGLRPMRGEKVKIGLQSAEKPALFASPEDENFVYLVMPVRMP